jgi:hypothetical protein
VEKPQFPRTSELDLAEGVGLMAYDNGRVRWTLMNQARELARSGHYADHAPILAQIETEAGFEKVRRWIDERAFRAQLNRLCEMAQSKHG